MKKALALILALVMAFALVGTCAYAEEWNVERPEGLPEGFPKKEITFIYPFGAGSLNDTFVRILGEKVKEMEGWKNSIVIQYAEGASGDIGWSKFVKAKADGYTLGFAPTAQQITAVGLNKPYTADNMRYIFNMMSDPGAVGVAANSPYETLGDLLKAAAENPGTISIGVTSTTGGEGLATVQLEKASGAKFNVVPFDGETEILTAVAGGNCDAFCLNVGDCTTFVDDGSIKFLAVGSPSTFYPDVPTYAEAGFDVVQCNSRAIAAPAGTDDAIIKYLSDCFVAAANSESVQAQIADIQMPADFMDCETAQATFEGYLAEFKALWESDPWM